MYTCIPVCTCIHIGGDGRQALFIGPGQAAATSTRYASPTTAHQEGRGEGV